MSKSKTFDVKKSKYGKLYEENEDYRRWINNHAQNSLNTAIGYFNHLGFICEVMRTTPNEISLMAKTAQRSGDFDTLRNWMEDLRDTLQTTRKQDDASEGEERSGSVVHYYIKCLSSYVGYVLGNKRLVPTISVATDGEGKYGDEVPPTPEQMARVIEFGDVRAKVILSIIAFAGCRPEVQGYLDGSDGLMISDLPEMDVDNANKTISFKAIPTRLNIRTSLSKGGHRYFSFLPEQGCNYLKNYLESRMQDGELLKNESPIIVPQKNGQTRFIQTSEICDVIRETIRAAGFSWRPYIWRRYAETHLSTGETKGLIIPKYRNFFMGWKGEMSSVYDLQKGMTLEKIEELRESYKRASRYLVTSLSKEDVVTVEQLDDYFLNMLLTDEQRELPKEQALELGKKALQEFIAGANSLKTFVPTGKGFNAPPPLPEPKLVRKWVDKAKFRELLLQPGSKKIEQDGDEYLIEVTE